MSFRLQRPNPDTRYYRLLLRCCKININSPNIRQSSLNCSHCREAKIIHIHHPSFPQTLRRPSLAGKMTFSVYLQQCRKEQTVKGGKQTACAQLQLLLKKQPASAQYSFSNRLPTSSAHTFRCLVKNKDKFLCALFIYLFCHAQDTTIMFSLSLPKCSHTNTQTYLMHWCIWHVLPVVYAAPQESLQGS